MYGFEGQTTDTFLDDARALIDLGVPHLSAFPLIDRSVREIGQRERRRRDEQRRETYLALVELLNGFGYTRYSSEDFAQATDNENKYQVDAWRFPKRDVLGLGAGSLGNLTGCFYSNIPELDRYFAAIAAGERPVARWARVSREQEIRRGVLLGAKYIHVDRARFAQRYGIDLEAALEPLLGRLRKLGVWTVDDDGIHVTDDGLQVISEIWSELILANLSDAARVRQRSEAAA
jgi:oxygen-independent coproporphyrinogen-3 oxidase